jgi:two-component system response regulator MtrA
MPARLDRVPRILLVEDDPAIRDALELALEHLGHEVITRGDGESGLDAVQMLDPSAVVLDVMLPGIDGFEVCRRLRRASVVPVIMLTARSDDVDVVVGLEAGADDYVTKPVRPRVLDARIKAVLRRASAESEVSASPERFGDLTIDRGALRVSKNDTDLRLTPMELRLLLELTARPGQVHTREVLLRSVWEHDYLGDSRLVDACIQRLRAKVEDAPAQPVMIQTVRGFGYRFQAP